MYITCMENSYNSTSAPNKKQKTANNERTTRVTQRQQQQKHDARAHAHIHTQQKNKQQQQQHKKQPQNAINSRLIHCLKMQSTLD